MSNKKGIQTHGGSSNPPQTQKIVASLSSYSGPLPHPDILQGYEAVSPNAANRIIKMAETEAGHRHLLEHRNFEAAVNNERMGMVFAFLLCAGAIVGGFYCILQGFNIAAFVPALPLGAIAYVFIQGKKK